MPDVIKNTRHKHLNFFAVWETSFLYSKTKNKLLACFSPFNIIMNIIKEGGINLNYILVVFASFASANRVKSLLKNKFDITSAVVQTPGSINLKSCSYSLKLSQEHTDTVWDIIEKNKLSSKGIFSASDYSRIR